MTDKNYKSIVSRLISTRSSVGNHSAFEGFVDLLAYLTGFVFILWLLTGIFWPGPSARLSLLGLGIAGVIALAIFGVIRPLIKRRPLTEIALRLEKYYGKLQSRLIGSLQLYDKLTLNRENYSIELIEKTIEDAGSEIQDLDFGVVIEKSKRPYYRLILAVLAIAFALTVSGQTFRQTGMLFLNPLSDIHRPTNLTLAVTPISHQAIKNDDVALKITAAGERVRQVDLYFRFDDGDWVKVPTEKLQDDEQAGIDNYGYTFRKIKRDIEYYAEAKRVKSDIGKITIIDPPRLVEVSVTLNYPSYTGLGSQTLPNNDGSVTALKGTEVNFAGRLNKPSRAASLVFDNETRKAMNIDSDQIDGMFVLTESGSYHVEISDSGGLSNPSPIEYDLIRLDDYPPQVQITFPAVDIDLDDRMLIPLEAAIFDDFGFSELELVYWTYSEGIESNQKRKIIKSDFGRENEGLVTYDWLVEGLYMLPGDLVYYYFEVFDNDAVSGAKSAVSKTFSARLPSLDEIMADITGSQDEIFKDFEETVNSQKELRDELEKISREMMQFSEVDWEKKQQIQQTLDRQQEIAEKLENIAEQMDEAIEKFEKNQMATVEMMEKMEELRDLMEEVASPELKEAMRKLQEAMAQMDPKKLQEAMKNFELSVEQMNENLDRMLALLQKYQLEQKIDTLAKMAEKLAQQQQEINEKLGQCQGKKDVSDLQKPQKNQEQGMESLREQFDDAKKLNDELDMISKEQMQNADKKVNSEELNKMMSQMSQCLSKCNKKNASQSGQQLEQEYQEMAQMFQQMLEQMQSEQMEMITEMLRKAISDILYLSHQQEQVIDSTRQAAKRLEGVREMARDQFDLQSACDRLAGFVSDITKETLFLNSSIMEKLGSALANMQKAIDQLNGRTPRRCTKSQIAAMAALNQSAATLMSALSQASQCQSSGTGMQSLMQKLGKMAQQQMQLNQGTQMMPMPMPGQMMGMGQKQAMQRLGEQQEALRKSLEELMNEYGNPDNVLGRLDQIEKEMKKVAQELRTNSLDQGTVRRQERILSRLLDAQKSVHRRDYSRRRQARTLDDIIRRGPTFLDLDSYQKERLAEDIKKALAEKYPKRYENQIREYFKALTEDQAIE
ncbi:MAG: hypothetical protein GY839_15480 [candidate division Zixibacteria bacterium]|nr:hypothetical protein [candidate division Zixibacteria bacterium]